MGIVKHYIYAAGAAALAFMGIYLYRKGAEDQLDKLSRDNLEAMRDAKDVRDEIQNDPFFVDRARRWVKKD